MPFVDDTDVIAADYYPVGLNVSIADTREVAAEVAAIASSADKQASIVLQAFNWGVDDLAPPEAQGRWPTAEEMRRMRDLSYLVGDFELMLWFDYYYVKPPGTTSFEHLEPLARALAAPYPTEVDELRCRGWGLTWKQSGAGRVAVQKRHEGRERRVSTRTGAHVGFRHLKLRQGATRVRVAANRGPVRSTSNSVTVRVERDGRVRCSRPGSAGLDV